MNYAYYFNGKRHTNVSTEYLRALGMDDDAIESLQRDAAEAQK